MRGKVIGDERVGRRHPAGFADADAIRAPLFVLQGANDPRVVRSESDQIVDAMATYPLTNQLSLRLHLAWRWGELVIMRPIDIDMSGSASGGLREGLPRRPRACPCCGLDCHRPVGLARPPSCTTCSSRPAHSPT